MTVADLRKDLEATKTKKASALFGSKVALRLLREGKAVRIFLASDCKAQTAQELKLLAKRTKSTIFSLNKTKDQLSDICKKPFRIAVVTILKSKESKPASKPKQTKKKKEK